MLLYLFVEFQNLSYTAEAYDEQQLACLPLGNSPAVDGLLGLN